ncbi:MAG: 16S rRNA processing protein RimM [Flavobacteriaceae bacterium]|mgnify:CR=1 FL=1|nr:16S rRNA processing protein RimM [Flavobacteriaceae bacterium]|tara:strand:- start:531 stop:1058 length:528 start_codon:yes stop_codon:yes gene_type:complete
MKKKDCYKLGKIIKKFSFKGEVIAKIDTDQPNTYEKIEFLFLEIDNKLVPYFIDNSKLHKSNLLRIKFQDIDSETKAQKIINKNIFLPTDTLPKLIGNKFYYHEIIGFGVIDYNHGKIGNIVGVNDQTAQSLFVIDSRGIEILIPITDEFITNVDRAKKEIHIKSPEGLINLFTN